PKWWHLRKFVERLECRLSPDDIQVGVGARILIVLVQERARSPASRFEALGQNVAAFDPPLDGIDHLECRFGTARTPEAICAELGSGGIFESSSSASNVVCLPTTSKLGWGPAS